MKRMIGLLCCMAWLQLAAQTKVYTTEVLVVGGSTGGTAAGIQAARSGVQTIIVEQTTMLGGMLTAAGVSCTDGNDLLHSGIWQDFRRALYAHYGTDNLASGWVSNTCFEPHVGDSIFKSWALKEKKLQVYYGWYFDKALKTGNRVTGASFINARQQRMNVFAQVVIDATDLGDVFASAGAGYDLGMESPKYSGEKEAREKNDIIQDLTWAAVLKDYGAGADKTIARPDHYNAQLYYCSTSDAPCNDKPYSLNTQKVLDYGKLTVKAGARPKYMLNWPPHGNDYYLNVVELSPVKRDEAYKAAKEQTLGFLYFLQAELGFKHIGLADDELDKGMALMPYHREGRRVKGVVRLNINHIKTPYQYTLYRTGIAVGDYPVDHHHDRYPGKVPDIDFPKVPSFNIPLGALILEKVEGLIVCEKGISVSNIANGTTRLQPVVLLTGQAAGILAVQCIKKEIQPRKASVREVQDSLLKYKCYIMPFADVPPADPAWEAVQRTGAMGIIKGTGVSVDWANKTFFYPDSIITVGELVSNLEKDFPGMHVQSAADARINALNLSQILDALLREVNEKRKVKFIPPFYTGKITQQDFNKTSLQHFDEQRPLTRKEIAVLMDYHLHHFRQMPVEIDGNIIFNE